MVTTTVRQGLGFVTNFGVTRIAGQNASSFITPLKRTRVVARKIRVRIPPRNGIKSQNDVNWERVQVKAKETYQQTRRFMQTNTGQAVLWGGLLWLLLTGRIGWIFDSFLFLLFIFSVVPVVGIIVLRWWVNRQLHQGQCPNCGSQVTGLKGRAFQCMVCGTVVNSDSGESFSVNDPKTATIDIEAKRVE